MEEVPRGCKAGKGVKQGNWPQEREPSSAQKQDRDGCKRQRLSLKEVSAAIANKQGCSGFRNLEWLGKVEEAQF